MTEKVKRKRSSHNNIRPIILHSTTSFIFLGMLIYTYIQARMPLDLTIVVCLFQLICAGIFAAIGVTRSDWEALPFLTPLTQNHEQFPTFPAVLILLMTVFSSCSVLAFGTVQAEVGLEWVIVVYLGFLLLPYFSARETFMLGRAIAINRQQKSKPLEEDYQEVEAVDQFNDLDSPSYKEQPR